MVWSSDPMNVGSSTPRTISSVCRCVRGSAPRRSARASLGESVWVPMCAIGARAVTLAVCCKARLLARPAVPGHRNDVQGAGVAAAPYPSVAVRQNAHSATAPTFPCRRRAWREIASLLNFLALLPGRRGLYLFERIESPWRSFRREGTLPVEARAMALNQVTLDDKYDLAKSRIFVTGFQAIVRLCLIQKERDRRAGLNTAGYVTGYRGSPLASLDQQFIRAQRSVDKYDIRFQAGVNEDSAATAIWGSQQAELRGEGKFDGVFGLWYGKGPGVDRTGDVFRHANFAGTSKHGGVL